jgi:hypothetical protein
MKDRFGQLLFPLLGGAFVGLFTWCWGRLVRRGKPFTPGMKIAVIYGSLFATGMCYAMAWDDKLASAFGSSRENLWIPLSIVWGVFLAYVAWRTYKGSSDGNQLPD